MSKRKLEATRANQERKNVTGNRRLPPGAKVRRRGPDRVWWIGGGVVALVVVVAVVAVLAFRGGSSGPGEVQWDKLQGLQTGAAPWTPGIDQLTQRLDVLGFKTGSMEGQVQHTHQHLDVWVNGKKIPVNALIGINEVAGYLTETHTHDTTGVIHVESTRKRDFTLQEFFAVWGVKLTDDCLGSYCTGGGKTLRAWLNGKPDSDIQSTVLKPHDEFAIVYGTKDQTPKKIPSSYKFPAGE